MLPDENAEEARRPRYATGFVPDEDAGAASAPERAAVQIAVPTSLPRPVQAAATAPADAGLPKVRAFELPIAQLSEVAEGSGLQWVNSDAAKIAAVQAAIAAEPKPVVVPRERPPATAVENAPLVLVETKRDLRDTNLPF